MECSFLVLFEEANCPSTSFYCPESANVWCGRAAPFIRALERGRGIASLVAAASRFYAMRLSRDPYREIRFSFSAINGRRAAPLEMPVASASERGGRIKLSWRARRN